MANIVWTADTNPGLGTCPHTHNLYVCTHKCTYKEKCLSTFSSIKFNTVCMKHACYSINTQEDSQGQVLTHKLT